MKDISIYNCGTLENPPAVGSIKETPTGPLYLVSALEREGYKVGFNDLQILKNPTTRSIMSSLENSSNIVGISCMSHLLPPVILWINRLKKKNPDKTVILGGPGPTPVAREILEASGKIDIVVRGEGERTIVEVMECLQKGKDLRDVRGITYRDGNRIRTNPPQPRIENLDELPFPAYDKIKINDYDVVGIVTSRGCPFKCGFCYIPYLWGGKPLFRSIENVTEEIGLIQSKCDNRILRMTDDIFTMNEKRITEFCKKVNEEGMNFDWMCYGKIDLMNEQLMKKMSESGCKRIFYGIESGSDRILKMINKGFTAKLAEDVIKKSSKYFQKTVASFIWGFPFETIEDFKKTLSIAEMLNFKFNVNIKLHLLTPIVGTPIYTRYKNKLLPCKHSRFFTNLPSVGGTFSEVFSLFEKGEIVFENFRNYPDIIANYHIYRTPDIEEKIKMILSFLKKGNLYISMVKKNLYT